MRALPSFATVRYEPEFGRAVRVAEFDRPMLSDDVETAQTVALMDELAARDSSDRSVIDATHAALDEAGLDMTADAGAKAIAIFWWLKRNIRYVPVGGTSALVDQTLIPPATLLAMPKREGDCPQFSMLASAMLRVCCIPSMYKTIAAEPAYPDTFSHIYNVVAIGSGRFLPFDSSNGPSPGSEYSRPLKRRIWPQLAPNRCKEPRHMQRTQRIETGYRSSSLKGSLGDIYDDAGVDPGYTGTQYGSQPIYTPTLPSGSGPSTGSILTTLLNDATALTVPIIRSATQQQPYFITNPTTGQSLLYNPNTGGTNAGAQALAAINPEYLIGGLVLFAVLAMSNRKA